MCEFQDSNGNGFRDIWWTDKFIYFSSIDYKMSPTGRGAYWRGQRKAPSDDSRPAASWRCLATNVTA